MLGLKHRLMFRAPARKPNANYNAPPKRTQDWKGKGMNYEKLSRLLELARGLPEPSVRERQEQALCLAHGNLACSANHKPSRSAFLKLAQERFGWSEEEFNAWADARKWDAP